MPGKLFLSARINALVFADEAAEQSTFICFQHRMPHTTPAAVPQVGEDSTNTRGEHSMIIIVDISIPADAFPLGRVLEEYPEVEIELERLVPLREAIIPLFWIDEGNTDGIETVLQDDPLTENVKQLTQTESRVLYEIKWDTEIDGLVQSIIETDAGILEAEGTADVWDFRLRFRTRKDLTAFREACESHDIPLTLRRLYNPSLPEDGGELSAEQYKALTAAHRGGYFEVPRGTSMGALAEEFGISENAVSQRIRRGTSTLVAETLLTNFSEGRS